MAELDDPLQPLSPYERAACYYTLPKVTIPISARFIILYGIVLLSLLCALTYAAVNNHDDATAWLIGIVVLTAFLGIILVMTRSLLNEVRRKRVLREAALAAGESTFDDDLPDPFEGHTLLRHPGDTRGRLFALTHGDDQKIDYFVESDEDGAQWRIRLPQDEEMLTVRSIGGAGSFAFVAGTPKRYGVFAGEAEVARVQDGGTLFRPQTDIIEHAGKREYAVRDGGIFLGDTLVGRVYYVHHAHYLDIHKDHLHEGTLGYFVTLI